MAFASNLMGIPVIATPSDVPANATDMRGYEQRDRNIDPTAGFAKPFTIKPFTRQEIKELIEERELKKERIFDRLAQKKVPPLHQGSTPYCWVNGFVDCVQIARVLSGVEHVPLSPASVGAPIKNYQAQGGWAIQAAKYAAEHGIAPVSLWPANAINKKYDTAECREERVKYAIDPAGWIDLPEGDWLAVWTCNLLGFPCTLAHMQWQHLVDSIDPVILPNGELASLCRNSGYGRDSTGHSIVKESFGKPDEALAIQVVTAG